MTFIHRILNGIGLEVRWRKNLEAAIDRERRIQHQKYLIPWKILAQYEIETVIDIGANNGQFASHIREILPDARILSFEPLPEVYRQLCNKVSNDLLIKVFPFALSDKEGEIDINQSSFSPSSSLLAMSELHKEEFPFSSDHSTISVQMRTLDGLFHQGLIPLIGNLLIKMDVQGHEDAVIRGAEHVISRAHLVIVEVGFLSLYEGQPLFEDIYDLMRSLGFVYRGSLDQYFSTRLNKFLFADAIFENINIQPKPLIVDLPRNINIT